MEPASEQQKKMFFAVANKLGLDPEETKERAKKKYGLESFKDINKAQLTTLIDILQQKIYHERNKYLDTKITDSGFIITTCMHCHIAMVSEGEQEFPTCNRLECVRKVFGEGGTPWDY